MFLLVLKQEWLDVCSLVTLPNLRSLSCPGTALGTQLMLFFFWMGGQGPSLSAATQPSQQHHAASRHTSPAQVSSCRRGEIKTQHVVLFPG